MPHAASELGTGGGSVAAGPSEDLQALGEVLIVNRDPEVRLVLQKAFYTGGYGINVCDDEGAASKRVAAGKADAVVISIETRQSIECLAAIKEAAPNVPVLAVAARATPELVRDVFRAGADDLYFGDLRSQQIRARFEALLDGRGSSRSPSAREASGGTNVSGTKGERAERRIIFRHPKMRRVLKIAEKIAPTDSTVLIQGESGTGKELIARWIHERSRRAEGPFVDVNCGALPENLLESQLFGHEKGSFTGAVQRQMGLFEVADGGTILLDEIGELSLAMQVKLLRVLQSREFRRIGGSKVLRVDVRVIAATNRDLKEEVEQGRFRADLFYRLNVISLALPPLRERRDEIPDLVESFCASFAEEKGLPRKKFSEEAIAKLQKFSWPGNVRELENAVERLILLSSGDTVGVQDIDEHLDLEVDVPLDDAFAPTLTLDEVKRLHIARVLRQNNGNKMRTARMLKINVKTLYNLIRSLDIKW